MTEAAKMQLALMLRERYPTKDSGNSRRPVEGEVRILLAQRVHVQSSGRAQ